LFYREKRASEKQSKDDKEAILSVPPETIPIPIHQVTDKQLPIPKALQQKSSALIPPLAPITTTVPKETNNPLQMPPTIKVSSVAPSNIKASTQPLKVEKMEVGPSGLEALLPKGEISSDSTPMEVLSPASVDSPAGVQNISPSLLAASLAAVCNEAPVPAVTSPLATLITHNDSVISAQSTDPKSTPVRTVSAVCTSIAASTAASYMSTLSTSSTPSDSLTPSSLTSSGLTSGDGAAPKDSIVPSSSSALPVTSDPVAVISKDNSVIDKPVTTPKTPTTGDSQASSIKTDLLGKTAVSTNIPTGTMATLEGIEPSAADPNPTTSTSDVANTLIHTSDSTSGLSHETRAKDTPTTITPTYKTSS
jgi:hypothetical protein